MFRIEYPVPGDFVYGEIESCNCPARRGEACPFTADVCRARVEANTRKSKMPEPITEAMLDAGIKVFVEQGSLAFPKTNDNLAREFLTLVFRAMEVARDAEKVELSPAAKDLVLRLAMGAQPDFDRSRGEISELREHRLVEAGSEQAMVRWGIKGELTPLPPDVASGVRRIFFRLTDKGAAYIAKETSNDLAR